MSVTTAAERKHCAWCGNEVKTVRETHAHPWFCPDCHDTYEAESCRSLHPVEERHPHND